MKGIRVVLAVTAASPELFAALQGLPARSRAERVRMLATLGLAAVSGGVSCKTASGRAADAPPGNTDSSTLRQDRATDFARTLGGNV